LAVSLSIFLCTISCRLSISCRWACDLKCKKNIANNMTKGYLNIVLRFYSDWFEGAKLRSLGVIRCSSLLLVQVQYGEVIVGVW
jgi:hypothetical protein